MGLNFALGGILISVVLVIRSFCYDSPYSIVIQGPIASDPYLNLREVYPSYQGSRVVPSDCVLSSTYSSSWETFPASLCCDGILDSYCHSGGDPDASLTVTVPSDFDTVTVYNRADYGSSRLVGATITISDANEDVIFSTTFSDDLLIYTFELSSLPTYAPTVSPTPIPSAEPTVYPSASPTIVPTPCPSAYPSASPTIVPTPCPSAYPSASPTMVPTHSPSSLPTRAPTRCPSAHPSASPTRAPSHSPSSTPTVAPTRLPTTSTGKMGINYGKETRLTSSQITCFAENKVEFFIPKGFTSKLLSSGEVSSSVDSNLCRHLHLANSSAMPIRGIIIQAVPAYGLRASTPCMELLKTIRVSCPYFTNPSAFGDLKVWLTVTENNFQNYGWFADHELNRRWFEKLVSSCKYYFGGAHRCGVFGTTSAWQSVFNDASYHNSTVFSKLSLWYSSPSTSMTDSRLNFNFRDYISGSSHIGNFDQPVMRQFGRRSLCGATVGVNWIQ